MATVLSPRERRRQRTGEAILDAARGIIRSEGVDALSMRAIASAIDYSPASLYEYYGSKEEIIAAVCGQGHERFKRYLQRVDTSLPIETYLLELGTAYIDFAVQNADFFLLMFTTSAFVPSSSGDHTSIKHEVLDDTSFDVLLSGVQRAIDEGYFATQSGLDALEIAYVLWAQVHGLAMLRVTTQHITVDYDVVDKHAQLSMLRGLRSL